MELGNYALPEGAHEALRRQNRQAVSVGDGVSKITAGHDQGVSYRFWVHTEIDKAKSKAARYEKPRETEMIEWRSDRYNKPIERLKDLGPELLEFDVESGECIGGRYAESYKRWKQGLSAPGLQLSKWGVLDDGWVAQFAAFGVYSVEQFAAMPPSKINSKFPKEVHEAFERAVLYVNMKEGRVESDKQADEIVRLQKHNSKLEATVAEMQEQMKGLLALHGETEKTGKNKKAVTKEENTDGK